MRRALVVVAISLFAVSASAAPRDGDERLFDRFVKVVQKIVRRLTPLDEMGLPKG